MKKFVCSVCGYVYEGDSAPAKCPQCGVGPEKFVQRTDRPRRRLCALQYPHRRREKIHVQP